MYNFFYCFFRLTAPLVISSACGFYRFHSKESHSTDLRGLFVVKGFPFIVISPFHFVFCDVSLTSKRTHLLCDALPANFNCYKDNKEIDRQRLSEYIICTRDGERIWNNKRTSFVGFYKDKIFNFASTIRFLLALHLEYSKGIEIDKSTSNLMQFLNSHFVG